MALYAPTPPIFQTINGIWSPADNAYTMIIRDEFDSYKEAKASLKGLSDPTLAIVEIRTRILWRASEPPYGPPAWATGELETTAREA